MRLTVHVPFSLSLWPITDRLEAVGKTSDWYRIIALIQSNTAAARHTIHLLPSFSHRHTTHFKKEEEEKKNHANMQTESLIIARPCEYEGVRE